MSASRVLDDLALVGHLAPALDEPSPSTLLWADLSLAADAVEQPSLVPVGLGCAFYRGRHNDVHGPPGAGKTWVLLSVFAHALDAGHAVLFLDYEDRPGTFRRRLAALGVPDDVILDPERVAYANIPVGLGHDELDDIELALGGLEGHVIVGIDAMADALTADGQDESSNREVTAWHRRVVARILRHDTTVIALDHVIKNPAERSNGARGAGAKLGLVDGVSYSLRARRGFGQHTPGILELHVAKDRHGAIGPTRHHAATIIVEPADNGRLTMQWQAPDGHSEQFRPTWYMDQVGRWLEGEPEARTKNQILRAVGGKAVHVREAVSILVDEGYVTVTAGPNRSTLHASARPYREDDDPQCVPASPVRPQ